MSTISYILAAYRGPREVNDPLYTKDPDHYLKQHVASLEHLHHDLDEIIVVLNEDGDRPLDLPDTIRSTTIRQVRRPNAGLSYGAFAHGVNLASSEFVILMEDDYMFTSDGFDKYLLERIQSRPNAGFCCGAAGPSRIEPLPHAPVFLGIASTDATRRALHQGYNGEPIVREDNSRRTGFHSQVAWSRGYIMAGYTLFDWLDADNACATWVSERSEVIWYDTDALPENSVPCPKPATQRHSVTRSSTISRSARSSRNITTSPSPSRISSTPTPTPIPSCHLTRSSLVVPQQALGAGTVDVKICGATYRAKLTSDGRLHQ